ncbi:MAG TPA: dockerin type I domain-containing protein, partial [Candidatus Hydrogenedentes bacterium]|nr:dockerin type I domain-containing protein [Candidatus Hydrogenedentota bacterium]
LAGTNPYDETDFPGNVPGDVNGSGKVDAVDVQLVINAALSIAVPYNCDINDDGEVNAVDVQLVINAALAR